MAQLNEALARRFALARVAAGRPRVPQKLDTAGQVVCMECGNVIPAKRLAIVPDAARCIDCQLDFEGA